MNNYKAIGNLIGTLVGCVLTGVCVYFTKNPFSSVIPFVCYLIGGRIGRAITKK